MKLADKKSVINSDIEPYIRDIAQRLKNPRENGGASLMVGAGLSKNASGSGTDCCMPDWSELAQKMFDELYPAVVKKIDLDEKLVVQKQVKTFGKNVTRLAEEYISAFDRDKMNRLIESCISDKSFVPSELHKKLLQLNWNDVFTTNYDTLLERASEQIFREYNYHVIRSTGDLMGSVRPRIIKLHGSIPDSKPYIISEEDYRKYPQTQSAFVNTVQQAMLETRLCLIGFSGDDPNFLNWLGWLRDNMGEYCPRIYMIGMYNDLSASEKALIINRSITIIDISPLVKGHTDNSYYTALMRFLELLIEYQTEENLYNTRPFSDYQHQLSPSSQEDYRKQILAFTARVYSSIESYVLLPYKDQKRWGDYYYGHFRAILRHDTLKNDVKLVAAVARMLRVCNVVLEDDNAEKLETILDIPPKADNPDESVIRDRFDIALYLLEMYRMDGEQKKYLLLVESIKNYDGNQRVDAELDIEMCKFHISHFNFHDAKIILDRIQPENFVQSVMKAGLLKQLRMNLEADALLRESSRLLAQMRVADDIYNSYLGYMNLCYRMGHFSIEEPFSDQKRFDAQHNTRRIIIDMRAKLLEKIYEGDKKRSHKNHQTVFLNTFKQTESIGDNGLFHETYRYLLAIDKLCLPVYHELKEMLPRIIQEIDNSSRYRLWRISLAIRSDDKKVIETIFSRERMISTDTLEMRQLFDRLLDDMFSDKGLRVFSLSTVIETATIMALMLDDESICRFLDCAIATVEEENAVDVSYLDSSIKRLSVRFNCNIGTRLTELIFSDRSKAYHLAGYFFDVPIDFPEGDVERLYMSALERAKNDDFVIRDNGVGQLLLLWRNAKKSKYRKQIIEALWKGEYDHLPQTGLYLPTIWESFPLPKDIDMGSLYGDAIRQYELVKSVGKGVILGNNSEGSVSDFFRICYLVSDISPADCKKVDYDKEMLESLFSKVELFFENEKPLLEGGSFPFIRPKKKFDILVLIITLLITKSEVSNMYSEIDRQCDELLKKMEMQRIDVTAPRIALFITRKDLQGGFEFFMEAFLAAKIEKYREYFFGLHCLLYYAEKHDMIEMATDLNLMKDVFSALKYMEIEKANAAWMHLSGILERDCFQSREWMNYLADIIFVCYKGYLKDAQSGSRPHGDALYNCLEALRRYSQRCKKNTHRLTKRIKKILEDVRETGIPEIDNIWMHEVL